MPDDSPPSPPREASPTDTISIRVLLLPAFAAADFATADPNPPDELRGWLERYDFEHVLDIPGTHAPLRYTDDGLAITPTGMGKADAAATVPALCGSPALDLSETFFLTVGIAGTSPAVGTLGSVFLSDAVVDWDRKHRWSTRDVGPDSSGADRPVDLLSFRARDYVYRLNEAFVAEARAAVEDVDLRDSDEASRHRRRYAHPQARAGPTVDTGTTLCGDEFWHGKTCSEQAQWLVEQYDAGPYATTEMEDYGTATALDRFGHLDRYLSIRGVVNFDRPPADESVVANLDAETGGYAYDLGLANLLRVGTRLVDHLLATRG